MKDNNIKAIQVTNYTFNPTLKRNEYFPSIRFMHSPSNCKLTIVDSIQYYLNLGGKKYFDELLKRCRQTVHLTVSKQSDVNFLKKHYEVLVADSVPVGYDNTDQYHIVLANPTGINGDNYLRKKVVKEGKMSLSKSKISRKAIDDKLRAILKNKRRKDDYVDEFLNELFK